MNIKKDLTTVNISGKKAMANKAIVLHIMDGSYQGSIEWFKNPNSNASTHYLISKNGEITQMVEDDTLAWANGINFRNYDSNDTRIAKIVRDNWGTNVNQYTIAIEHEGRSGEIFGDTLVTASAELVKYLCDKHNIIPSYETIIPHSQIDIINRANCPGISNYNNIVNKILNSSTTEVELNNDMKITLENFSLILNATTGHMGHTMANLQAEYKHFASNPNDWFETKLNAGHINKDEFQNWRPRIDTLRADNSRLDNAKEELNSIINNMQLKLNEKQNELDNYKSQTNNDLASMINEKQSLIGQVNSLKNEISAQAVAIQERNLAFSKLEGEFAKYKLENETYIQNQSSSKNIIQAKIVDFLGSLLSRKFLLAISSMIALYADGKTNEAIMVLVTYIGANVLQKEIKK